MGVLRRGRLLHTLRGHGAGGRRSSVQDPGCLAGQERPAIPTSSRDPRDAHCRGRLLPTPPIRKGQHQDLPPAPPSLLPSRPPGTGAVKAPAL